MYFTPHLITRNSAGSITDLRSPKLWGPDVVIVPRGACSFRRVDLKSSGRNALQAARLRARKEVLPHEDKLRIVKDYRGLGAGIWSYASDIKAAARSLPESLARKPLDNGVRLVKCLEGLEGQVWAENSLVASRWWPSAPSPRQWQTFLMAAPVDEDALGMPAPIDVPFRKNFPIFDMDVEQAADLFSPAKLAFSGGIIGVCVMLYMGAQYMRYGNSLRSAQSQIAHMTESAGEILSQRRRALGNMEAARRFDVLGDPAIVLRGFDGLAQTLKGQGFYLRAVRIQDGEIEARVVGDISLNGPKFVERLEASPVLSAVSVTVGGDDILIIRAALGAQSQGAQP